MILLMFLFFSVMTSLYVHDNYYSMAVFFGALSLFLLVLFTLQGISTILEDVADKRYAVKMEDTRKTTNK